MYYNIVLKDKSFSIKNTKNLISFFIKFIIYLLNSMNIKNNCVRSGAYILIDSLVQNGVEHIFGYPGGAILPIYDELYHWEKSQLT
jgi:hypothetical protein